MFKPCNNIENDDRVCTTSLGTKQSRQPFLFVEQRYDRQLTFRVTPVEGKSVRLRKQALAKECVCQSERWRKRASTKASIGESVRLRKRASAKACICESVRHKKRVLGVAKRPREISSDQPRRQNSCFFRKQRKSQKTQSVAAKFGTCRCSTNRNGYLLCSVSKLVVQTPPSFLRRI